MKYVIGVFYVLVALVIVLWAALSEFGGVTSIINEKPTKPFRIIILYGKVIVFYPYMAYLSYKLGRAGIKKFTSSVQPETTSNK